MTKDDGVRGGKRKDAEPEPAGEMLRDAREIATIEERWHVLGDGKPPRRQKKKKY
jgi:hypothetical protein